MRDNRIRYFASADYSEGTELDKLVKAIVDRTASNEILENIHFKYEKEYKDADRLNDEGQKKKMDLIIALENSVNFKNTHTIIRRMRQYEDGEWSEDEIQYLMDIAVDNSQVFYILKDNDVKNFYKMLLNELDIFTESAQKVREELEEE